MFITQFFKKESLFLIINKKNDYKTKNQTHNRMKSLVELLRFSRTKLSG